MKGAKRNKPVEAFDVTEFLRPDDQDLRSALASLMGVEKEREEKSEPGPSLGPPANLGPGPELAIVAGEEKSGPGLKLRPGINLGPGANLGPGLNLTPEPLPVEVLRPEVVETGGEGKGLEGRGLEVRRQYPLRRAQTAEEGHSRGEQTVYDALWRHGMAQADGTRRLQVGMLGLARLAGMSESNVRVNLRGLVQKLAVEEETGYVCEAGQGRTWRVFGAGQVLERRRQAGMEWYRKRTLAVVFEEGVEGEAYGEAASGAGVMVRSESGRNS